MLDYVIEILSGRGNRDAMNKYMNIEYSMKSFLNNAVLGTPFPDADIMTSRIIPIVYRGASEAEVKEKFLSEAWTIWGLVYVFFGWWGGLGAIFILALLMQIGFLAILRFCGRWKYYVATYYLFGSSVAGFFLNSGFDHWLTIVFYFFLSSATTFALLYGTAGGIEFVRMATRYSVQRRPSMDTSV